MTNEPKKFKNFKINSSEPEQVRKTLDEIRAFFGGKEATETERLCGSLCLFYHQNGHFSPEIEKELKALMPLVQDWPDHLMIDVRLKASSVPAQLLALFIVVGNIPKNSCLVSEEVKKELQGDSFFQRARLRRLLIGAAYQMERYLPWAHGLSDEEIELWTDQIIQLPFGVTEAMGDSGAWFAWLHMLGISDRGMPEGNLGSLPEPEMEEDPDADKDPIIQMRRTLWMLHQDEEAHDSVVHARVEGILGKLVEMNLPPYFLQLISLWAHNVPNSARALLVRMGLFKLKGPFANEAQFLHLYEVPIVKLSRGRTVCCDFVNSCWLPLGIKLKELLKQKVQSTATILTEPMIYWKAPSNTEHVFKNMCLMIALGYHPGPYPENLDAIRGWAGCG